MEEDEFYSYLESLSPEEQEQALYDFGFMNSNALPSSYGGAMPQLSGADYGLGSYLGLPPPMDKKGNLQAYGQDQMTKGLNQLQDIGALTVDPAIALYGGTGAYDPEAFQPTQIPIGSPLDMSDDRYLKNLIGASGGGYKSYLAQKIQGGMDPGAAVAKMWEFINMGGEDQVGRGDADARKALIASLPPSMRSMDPAAGRQSQGKIGDYSTPEGRMASVDLQSVLDTADDLFERQSKIPQVGYVDPDTGLPFAGARYEDSPLAAKYRAAGIPLPTETYGDEEWLGAPVSEETLGARQTRNEAADKTLRDASRTATRAGTNFDDLTRQYEEWEAARDKGVHRDINPRTNLEEINPYGLPEDVLNATNKAAVEQWRQMSEPNTRGAPAAGQNPILMGIKPGPREIASALGENFADQGGGMGAPSQQAIREGLQRQAAEKMLGTAPMVRREAGGRVTSTYDFGGTTRENALADTLASQLGNAFPGGTDYEVMPLNRSMLRRENSRARTARARREEAYDAREKAYQKNSSEELNRARALGRASALQEAGRTPTNDVLMQRAMARRMLLGQG